MTIAGRLCSYPSALMMFAVLAAGTAPAVAAPVYRVELIAPNTTGAGEARAVNAAGDVAGMYNDTAFVWHAGHFRSFPAERSFYLGDSYRNIATAINRAGTAAGVDGEYTPCSMSGLELTSAVTYNAHGMHFVDRSRDGMCSFEADGINDRGTIVGESGFRGFIRYADGHELGVEPLSSRPENNGTRATALDNENHIVGGTTVNVANVPRVKIGEETPNGGKLRPVYGPDYNAYVIHAFLLTVDGPRRRMRDLGALPGFPDTIATAINEDLTVVGYSGNASAAKLTRVSGPSHAWVWQHGRMTDLGSSHTVLDIKKGVDSYAYAVNDAGVIVGCSRDDAVRWVDKRMQNLNALIDRRSGWHLTCARGINCAGIIVGTGEFGNSGSLPFRLVPLTGDRNMARRLAERSGRRLDWRLVPSSSRTQLAIDPRWYRSCRSDVRGGGVLDR